MSRDLQERWAQCLLGIERRLPRAQTFDTWFRRTTARRFDKDVLEIEVPSSYFGHFVQDNYLPLIQSVVEEETGLCPRVAFAVVDRAAAQADASGRASSQETGPEPPEEIIAEEAMEDTASPLHMPLNERYVFETFVVGEGNRLTYAAAQAVSRSPGSTQFNPLVVHGGVGLGKTHLLQAIGHHLLATEPSLSVVYVTAEKFLSDFIESLRQQKTSEFQRLYRSVNVLLVDDIQFLIRSEGTQNEFFHTFNTLHQNGRQIVMTCDGPPGELKGLEERLISRFQWGLVTSIEPPDLETRIAILQKKAEINGIHLPEGVAGFLGNYISSNIRELEGALNHIMAYCAVNQVELSVDAARRVVQQRSIAETSKPSIEGIQKRIADHFDLTLELLTGKTRKREISGPRQIAMYLVKRHTGNPLKVIGLHFGNRDHSTVIHAIQTVDRKCNQNPDFARMVESLSEQIQKSIQR